jgi:hypothetical protein
MRRILITLVALMIVLAAGLVVVRAQVTHQVVLSWTASVLSPGAPPVTQYNILRGSTAGGEGATPIGNSVTTNYTDTTVVGGSTYFYAVTAQNQCNGASPIAPCVSGKSNEIGPLLIPNNVAPNPPTGLTGTVQ